MAGRLAVLPHAVPWSAVARHEVSKFESSRDEDLGKKYFSLISLASESRTSIIPCTACITAALRSKILVCYSAALSLPFPLFSHHVVVEGQRERNVHYQKPSINLSFTMLSSRAIVLFLTFLSGTAATTTVHDDSSSLPVVQNLDVIGHFRSWMEIHEKTYDTHEETHLRMNIWMENHGEKKFAFVVCYVTTVGGSKSSTIDIW